MVLVTFESHLVWGGVLALGTGEFSGGVLGGLLSGCGGGGGLFRRMGGGLHGY